MASTTQVLVPDIGGFKDVDVIDVLVKAGQEIDKETPMITIETEKAAMDVPAPGAGRIAELKVKKGDKVSEGSLILLLESTAASAAEPDKPAAPKDAAAEVAAVPGGAPAKTEAAAAPAPAKREKTSTESASNDTAKDSTRPQAAAPEVPAPPPAADDQAAAAAPPPRAAGPIDDKAFSTAYASPSVR